MPDKPTPMEEFARLSDAERISLYTLMGQWTQNLDLQATKVAEWYAKRETAIGTAIMEATREHIGLCVRCDSGHGFTVRPDCEADIIHRAREKLKEKA